MLTGFIDAVAGGGGLIMLPACSSRALRRSRRSATNKLQSVFDTAVATRSYARAGLVKWRDHKLAMALVFIGASASVLLVQTVDAVVLNLIIPLLLVSVAVYVLVSPRMTKTPHQRPASADTHRSAGSLASTTASSVQARAPSSRRASSR